MPVNTEKARRKAELEAKARQLFNDHRRTYGHRRLSHEPGKAGMKSGHYQVRHLMSRLGLKVRYPKRFKVATDSNHNEAVSPNRLERRLNVAAPNQAWTTDISYIWTLEGWPCLAVAIGLFPRQVVGWAAEGHMGAELCVCALQRAFLPKGHKGAESQSPVCPTIRIGVANTPATDAGGTWLSWKWGRAWAEKAIVGSGCLGVQQPGGTVFQKPQARTIE